MNKTIIKAFTFLAVVSAFVGCSSGDYGELTGVPNRRPWFHPQPFGAIYVPTGTFMSGQSDQDVFRSYTAPNKQMTMHAFWMDDTEITNNEYRQFVYYVMDSIARYTIGEPYVAENEKGEMYIDYEEEFSFTENAEDLEMLYVQGPDRYENRKEFDKARLVYSYKELDWLKAANNNDRFAKRRNFMEDKKVQIYPDTLCWVRDFTYSYNEPLTRGYFWHPKYDDYPVVGVNWEMANAFCHWRTFWRNKHWDMETSPYTEDWRLPSEYEWEYAARGGRDNNMYPWGGPYTRNSKGCFLANFKPNRGNYTDDGGYYPVRADSYFPNDYGLYNMSGNVAEWTRNAYTEQASYVVHDMNADIQYNASEEKDGEFYVTRSRKVVRGGSWKDIAHFIQNSSRSYEFQDTTKCYLGFRTVQTYIGRSALDRR